MWTQLSRKHSKICIVAVFGGVAVVAISVIFMILIIIIPIILMASVSAVIPKLDQKAYFLSFLADVYGTGVYFARDADYSTVVKSTRSSRQLYPPPQSLEILCNDITKETTDIIMHVIEADFSVQGGVATSLIKAVGDDILNECLELDETPLFSIQYTTAGKLLSK